LISLATTPFNKNTATAVLLFGVYKLTLTELKRCKSFTKSIASRTKDGNRCAIRYNNVTMRLKKDAKLFVRDRIQELKEFERMV